VARKISFIFLAVALFVAMAVPSAGAMDLSRLMAPVSVCGAQIELDAPAAEQERGMRCMTNFARRQVGLGSLDNVIKLDRSAADKSDDVLRCDSFSHYACGREFTYWMQRAGYFDARRWRAGENLAWGGGEYGTVRSIFRAWLESPGHRENILGPYSQIGIGLQIGTLDGYPDAHVWTQHFGWRR
jgi:uncharacterized protein YkwD